MPLSTAVLLVVAAALAGARLIDDSSLGLYEVAWHSEPSHVYLGSPSILRLHNGDLVVSVDHFGTGFKEAYNASLYRSTDNGATWAFDAWIVSQYWSNLFQLDPSSDTVFCLGTASSGPTPIKIARSTDGGHTWGPGAVLSNLTYETGPTPSLISGGRVYRAMERMPVGGKWPTAYQAVILSAPVTANLLDPASWTITAPLPFDPAWIASWGTKPDSPGFLEGNAVAGPDGTIYNILRFNTRPVLGNKAVVLRLTDLHTLEFHAIIDLPGGHTKFVIHRDPVTSLYMALTNPNTNAAYQDQRNILVLSVSENLMNWTAVSTLLTDDSGLAPADSVRYTGFHYVDWQFDGPNIVYAIRTAYRGANSYHNSNRVTVKTLSNYTTTVLVLSNLSISTPGVDVSPQFAPGVFEYVAPTQDDLTAIELVATSFMPSETLLVQGHPVTSGQPAKVPVDLSSGAFNISLVVGAGTPYRVTVVLKGKAEVAGKGFTVQCLTEGCKAFSDRAYVFRDIPQSLSGLCFTQIAGGAAPGSVDIHGSAEGPGYLYAFTHSAQGGRTLQAAGWAPLPGLAFSYTDAGDTMMSVFQRPFASGESFKIPQSDWTGASVAFVGNCSAPLL